MRELVLASNNPGKLREFGQMLAPLDWQVRAQREFGVEEVPEPHATFVENALVKARHAAAVTGRAALADDSGLCVPLLGGAPGVHSARFAGEPKDDGRNNAKLVALLSEQARGEDDWRAFFVAVLVFVRAADDPLPVIAEGRWHGRVVAEARGAGGFGYDPHFFVPDAGMTAAELDDHAKHARSHRGQALRELVRRLSADA